METHQLQIGHPLLQRWAPDRSTQMGVEEVTRGAIAQVDVEEVDGNRNGMLAATESRSPEAVGGCPGKRIRMLSVGVQENGSSNQVGAQKVGAQKVGADVVRRTLLASHCATLCKATDGGDSYSIAADASMLEVARLSLDTLVAAQLGSPDARGRTPTHSYNKS